MESTTLAHCQNPISAPSAFVTMEENVADADPRKVLEGFEGKERPSPSKEAQMATAKTNAFLRSFVTRSHSGKIPQE